MVTAPRPHAESGVALEQLVADVGAVPAEGSTTAAVRITGVTLRAQDCRPGDLFAALAGTTTHGASYAGQAVEAGAAAVFTDSAGVAMMAAQAPVLHGTPIVVHATPRAVLGELAANVYGRPADRIGVIGVTGTSGKTTIAYLVEAGLRAAGRTAGVIGTVGVTIDGADLPSALTTPEAPDLQALLAVMAERGADTVVMEVSSHALALGRVDGIGFVAGGFTNLSRDHLDFHQSMRDYFEAKARLFDPASPLRARTAVICVDDEAGRAMATRYGDAITVSVEDRAAHWHAEDVVAAANGGQEFTAVDPTGARHRVGIRLPGDYNVGNCLIALALLAAAGVSPNQASSGLRAACVPGRLEPVDRGQDFVALVDYAHKPGALGAVLKALRRPESRLAVVFGAGGDRDPGKRAPMGRVAAELADLVVVTDDNPRSEVPAQIRRQILSGTAGGAEIVEIGDRGAAIGHAVAWARAGDVVVVAGKGHETGQSVGEHTHPFDDREQLAAALEARRS